MKRALLLAIACVAVAASSHGAVVVLVPGMTGSRLCSSSGALLWGNSSRLLRPWDGGYRLALPLDGSRDDVVPCGVIREMRVLQWRKDIYGGLIAFMERNGVAFYAFDHDWRRDTIENAQKLVAFLREIAAKRGDNRFRLICQSNGAYMCRYAARFGDATLEQAESGEARPPEDLRIETIVLIGNANGGALRILKELNNGRQYLRHIGRWWRPETLFTYPSLFQDLPADTPELFNAENWRKYQWSIYAPAVQRRASRFGTEEQRADYLSRMLDRAQRMHALLRRDSPGPLPQYHSIQSHDLPTPATLKLEQKKGGWRTSFLTAAGDRHATVESQNALSPRERTEPIYVGGKHFEMITAPATQELLLRLLEAPPLQEK